MNIRKIVTYLLRWFPTIMGLLFLMVVKLNHFLFKSSAGNITARDCIGHEMIILFISFIVLLVQPVILIKYIMKKKWQFCVEIILSFISFFILLYLSVEFGAAIIYAT